jgi:hypothetical protein
MRTLGSLVGRAGLGHLGLEDSCLGTAHIAALLESLPAAGLVSLNLNSNNIGAAGARALAAAPVLGGLQVLRLGCNQFGVEGIEALAAAPVDNVTTLHLPENRISAKAAEVLANSARLGRLRELELRSNAIGDAGLTALVRSPVLRLSALGLGNAHVGPAGARVLARSATTKSLAWLDLFSCREFCGPAVRLLAESPHLSGLRGLALYAVHQEEPAFLALAGSEHLANLESLDLSHTDLTERAALALAESPYLKRLRALTVYANSLTRTAWQAIRKRWRFATV